MITVVTDTNNGEGAVKNTLEKATPQRIDVKKHRITQTKKEILTGIRATK